MQAKRVVVVDDERAIRVALSELLAAEGFLVDAVPGGAEALDLLANGPDVDALLIDLFMPGMTGCDLVRAIRSDSRHAGVPILLITGAVYRPEDFPPAGQYQSVIEKPFAFETVVGALRRVTGAGRRLQRP